VFLHYKKELTGSYTMYPYRITIKSSVHQHSKHSMHFQLVHMWLPKTP